MKGYFLSSLGIVGILIALSLNGLVGCKKVADIPVFSGVVNRPSSPVEDELLTISNTTIDAGEYVVNYDTSASCTAVFANGTGCMQPLPILYADNRWHVGFTQNFLSTLPTKKYSAMVTMSSLATGLFGSFGFGISIIDSGLGVSPLVASASSRYIQFAKLANEDVLAIMYVEDVANNRRIVGASSYNHKTHVWGNFVQLSDSAVGTLTDRGVEYQDSTATNILTASCRPSIATSGNTALAAWCEDTGASGSRIVYSFYNAGVWSPSGGSTPTDVASYSTQAWPGFHAITQLYNPGSNSQSVTVGDVFQSTINLTTTTRDVASVEAVADAAGQGQFNIVYDSTSGDVLTCPTLENMATAMLADAVESCVTPYAPADCTATTRTLASDKVSIKVNPDCDNDDDTTWTISMYYNYSLDKVYRVVSGGSETNVINGFSLPTLGAGSTSALGAATAFSVQNTARRSSLVSVAGDGYGNYSLVRSLVSPIMLSPSISNTYGTGWYQARMLVGHQYTQSGGFVQRSSATGSNQAEISQVSLPPACYQGSDDGYTACSVKNPKFLMSNSGDGLVLFYQKQVNDPNVNGSTVNPNRLWYATYSTGTGFSVASATVDSDTYCSSTSVANDADVCETGIPSTTYSEACLVEPEPVGNLPTTMNHDLAPIPAAMNASGKAIVAYHKKYESYDNFCDSYAGLFVSFYDPGSGFSTPVQIDSGGQQTMHAQVSINSSGNAAVVWEQIDTNAQYIYLRTYSASTQSWRNIELVNDSTYGGFEVDGANEISLMPSVGINDSNQVIVTYSRTSDGVRRLYTRLYAW